MKSQRKEASKEGQEKRRDEGEAETTASLRPRAGTKSESSEA